MIRLEIIYFVTYFIINQFDGSNYRKKKIIDIIIVFS